MKELHFLCLSEYNGRRSESCHSQSLFYSTPFSQDAHMVRVPWPNKSGSPPTSDASPDTAHTAHLSTLTVLNGPWWKACGIFVDLGTVFGPKAFLWITSINIPKQSCSHERAWEPCSTEKLYVGSNRQGRYNHLPPGRRN